MYLQMWKCEKNNSQLSSKCAEESFLCTGKVFFANGVLLSYIYNFIKVKLKCIFLKLRMFNAALVTLILIWSLPMA